jgi:hypothetical protein
MPRPPEELSNLHFARLDLEPLRPSKDREDISPPVPLPVPKTRLETSFPIFETVDSVSSWVPWLQEQMGELVPFLEELIGIRYFPPVTFLVDEHVVRATREVLTTDAFDGGEDVLEPVLEILRALALAFHVGKLVDPEARGDRATFFEAHGGESVAAFDHVRIMAEYVFDGPTKDYLAGKDVFGKARRSLTHVLEAIVDSRQSGSYASGYNAAKMARQTLEKASAEERVSLSNVMTAYTLKKLESLKDSERRSAATQLLDSALPGLADKYGVVEFFRQPMAHTLAHHQQFEEYLADFVRHWIGYIRIARSKRPDAVIDVGYSVHPSALEWLQRTFRGVNFNVTRIEEPDWHSSQPRAYFAMPIYDYEQCVEQLSGLLFSMLSKGRTDRVVKLVNTVVSTHGIYIPAFASEAQAELVRSLTQRGWAAAAALPGQHKVLLCMGAVERFEEELVEMGWDKDEAHDLARRFCVSVLVHEHFHAAIATGLDQTGRAALGAEHPRRWQTASTLNESLAVWCERHLFRSDPKMLDLIDGYIASGTYPTWPYRGGEVIERFHGTGGTPAVRGWMGHLRDDPENAQREFDQRVLAS